MLALGAGFLASAALLGPAGDAGATRIEYYATVGERLCDMDFAKSGLGYCDVAVGTGVRPKRGELINRICNNMFCLDGFVRCTTPPGSLTGRCSTAATSAAGH